MMTNKAQTPSYRPLGLTVAYITFVTLLIQYPFDTFSLGKWMQHFMAGFLIVFSFFKCLNLAGFAKAYALYDIIAKRWYYWGYCYPFIELGMGLWYLTSRRPFYLHIFSALLMAINSIGVIAQNRNKNKIQCACLGDVFNLPMSKITIIENVGMMVMAMIMFLMQ